MKKIVLIVGLLLANWSLLARAMDSHLTLQQRLGKVDSFYANFEQRVTTAAGKLIQKGKGQLWIKRPYLFNWKMVSPDEMSIISDGKTVWIYTVLLEQVTAINLKEAMDNRLLILLTSDDNRGWQDYLIVSQGDRFIVRPRNNQGQHFAITINDKGILKSIAIIEEDGQRSFYQFSHQKLGHVTRQQFKFILPDGVTLDDQR